MISTTAAAAPETIRLGLVTQLTEREMVGRLIICARIRPAEGLYAQDQVKLDRWTLTLTGRQDLAQAETVSKGIFPAAGTYLQNDRASTGRVGLNYLFDNGISPYANYSTSFVPTTGTDQFGHVFKPTTGEGAEIGVKFKPSGSNLMSTLI